MIQDELGLSCAPRCTICHETERGGAKTLVDFGVSAFRAGLRGANNGTVAAALDKLVMSGTDTDQDGTGDVDELLAGNDPNGRGGMCPSEEGGCALGQVGAVSHADPAALLAAAGIAIALLRRVRRSPRVADSL